MDPNKRVCQFYVCNAIFSTNLALSSNLNALTSGKNYGMTSSILDEVPDCQWEEVWSEILSKHPLKIIW